LFLKLNLPLKPPPPQNLYQQSKRKQRLLANNLQSKRLMKQKSQKQVAYLLSKSSPLSKPQQSKLKSELHSGAVKVKKGK
jgi:hypothetical protein